MNEPEVKPSILSSKAFGALLLAVGMIIEISIVLKIVFYQFEYVPDFAEHNYGRFIELAYFTILSNILTGVYLILSGLAAFGRKWAKAAVDKPWVELFITTYILITGFVYNGGIVAGYTPALTWKTPHNVMISLIQILHHMVVPVFMLVLWCVKRNGTPLKKHLALSAAIFPTLYSLFSVIHGALMQPHFYPYPFYNPEYINSVVFAGKAVSVVYGYLIMLPLLIAGISLFVIVALLLIVIRNKRIS